MKYFMIRHAEFAPVKVWHKIITAQIIVAYC